MKKIHPIFHIAFLEKTNRTARVATNIEIINDEDETEYEAEGILDFKRVSGKPYYLIKWKGYPNEENTWEPTENLRGCSQLLQSFHTRRPTTM